MKIDHLKIFAKRFQDQEYFYKNVLGLPVKTLSEKAFEVQIGYSVLQCHYHMEATPYHIAFHIPPLEIGEALTWLEKKLEVLRDGGKKIIDFPAWDARSVYFRDADGNVLELISRRDLFPVQKTDFSSSHLLGVAEIGVATRDVARNFRVLNTSFKLDLFTGDQKNFCATGDDLGLFIIINKEQKDLIPEADEAFASDFEIRFSEGPAVYQASYKNEILQPL